LKRDSKIEKKWRVSTRIDEKKKEIEKKKKSPVDQYCAIVPTFFLDDALPESALSHINFSCQCPKLAKRKKKKKITFCVSSWPSW
jgi:hypothetical protein